jgi:hypothetical protein
VYFDSTRIEWIQQILALGDQQDTEIRVPGYSTNWETPTGSLVSFCQHSKSIRTGYHNYEAGAGNSDSMKAH